MVYRLVQWVVWDFCCPWQDCWDSGSLTTRGKIPRYSTPLQTVTDSGSENDNMVIKHTVEELNISHVATSYYYPQGNFKIEQFPPDITWCHVKKGKWQSWYLDIYLNQVPTATRLSIKESTKFSPFYLLYKHAPVLPTDNISKLRRM